MTTALHATHIVGGDIRYECLGYNAATQEVRLRIIMHVYRDAINGQAGFDNPAAIGIFNSTSGSLPYTTLYMYNPTIVNVPINAANPCMIVPPNIAVEEGLYIEEITLPYDPNGYTISYQRCCRNNTINNLVAPGSTGSTYTIFLSGLAQTTCNSSPYFVNFPPPVICQNAPLVFDHSAIDPNGHTLRYSLCNPMHGASQTAPQPDPPAAPPYSNITFSAGFNANYPLTSSPALNVNVNTGLMTGTPTQLGQFVVGVCVTELDANGNMLSMVLRDFQFNVAYCEAAIHAAVQSDSVDASGSNFFMIECGGNTTMSFVNQSTDMALINAYEWRFVTPGGALTSTAVNPTITFPGPGTYTGWLVPNPGQTGCSDTAFLNVTILPPITTAFQSNFPPCAPSNTAVAFTSQTSGGAGGYQYNWNFGNGATSTAANPSYSYGNNPGNYTVTLVTTDAEGCTATATGTVAWFPPTNMNITYNYHGCRYDTLQFFNNSTPLVAGYTHVWNFGDGSPNSTAAAPSHVYTTPGSYTVTLTTTSPTGCVSTYTHTFVVRALPVASFTMTYDSCDYAPVQFTSTSTPASAPITNWSWDFQDGTFSAAANPQHLYTLAGTYPVGLTVTDANGCQGEVFDSIEWYPRPVIAVNVPQGAGCAPYYIFFDNQSYPINGYTTAWSFGDGNTSLLASPGHTYQNPGTYYVNLLITSPLGCQATFTDTVLVYERPNANFSFSFDLCEIEPVVFNEFSTPNSQGVALVDWEWNFDDGTPLLHAQDTAHLYALAGDFDVLLVVTDANGCTDTTTQLVQWHPAPIVAVDVSDSAGCQPLVVTFVNNSYPINGYSTVWNFGDGGSSTQASPTHVFAQHGVFNVHLHILSPTGCTGDFYDTITVLQKPDAAFAYNYDSCSLTAVTITDLSEPNLAGDSLTTWIWDFGDGGGGTFTQSFGDTVYNYVPRNDYLVSLVVEDANGCRDTFVQNLHYYPAPVFPVASHSDTTCVPASISFFNNIDNNYPGYSFVWDFGNGQTSTVFDTNYIYPDRGVYYPSLTVTSAAGCIETFTDTIRVNGNPIASFSAVYDPCAVNGAMSFMNTSTPSPDGYLTDWLWDFGNGTTATNYKNDHFYTANGTYTVNMQVTDINGCTDDTTRSIVFDPQPVYPIDLENSRGCVPLFIDNPDDTPYPLAGYSLVWTYGDGRSNTDAEPADYYYTVAGNYSRKVVITSPIGCIDSFISTHVALPVPTAVFSYNPNPVNSFAPTVNFVDASVDAAAWHWDFGENAAQSYQQNPTYTYIDTGLMQVQLIATHLNGCTDTATQEVDVIPRYTYFLPNAFTPNNDGKNDGYRGNGFFEYIMQFEMQIYNRWGECIFRTNSPYEAWNGRKNNTGELCQAGVYVVMVRLQGGRDEPIELKGFATIVY